MTRAAGPNAKVSLARLAAALLACGAASLGAAVIAPHVGLPVTTEAWAARVAFAAAFTFVSAEILFVATVASPLRGPVALGAALLLAGALGALALVGPAPEPRAAALVAMLLLGAGSALGVFVGNRILHVGHLGVVAIVSSIADVTSVFHEA